MSELISKLHQVHKGLVDHARGCQGRNYSCDCGYDEEVQELCGQAERALSSANAHLVERVRKAIGNMEMSSYDTDALLNDVLAHLTGKAGT